MVGLVVEEESDKDDYNDVAEFSFIQKGNSKTVPVSWIPLNRGSTAKIFSNLNLIKNTRHDDGRYINIHCNARVWRMIKDANLKGYGTVWFDKGDIANIFYFHKVKQRFPIHYDFDEDVF